MSVNLKKTGQKNPNGLFHMDMDTWDSIMAKLRELKRDLDDFMADPENSEVFDKFHRSNILLPNGKMLHGRVDSKEIRAHFSQQHERLEMMVDQISIIPVYSERKPDTERLVRGEIDFIIRIHIRYCYHNSPESGGDAEILLFHQDVCLTRP